MKRFLLRQTQFVLLLTCVLCTMGCGLFEGIHVSRDEGRSTSRFRYEFEMVPSAVVMREDTEPRWQLGRYVFVRGADKVLVISRITSWSETATKKQRESGDIPDMTDQILERLWITVPQGTAVGEELDLHALSYRFLANYDRGMVGDAQFAHPFRALGNIRILEEDESHVRMRIRIRLTTDSTTAWEVFEGEINVPVIADGRYAKQAAPDAVIYSLSRPGELPSTGMTPVKITPEMTETPSTSGPVAVIPDNNQGNAQAANPNTNATTPPPAMTNGTGNQTNALDQNAATAAADAASAAAAAAQAAQNAQQGGDPAAAADANNPTEQFVPEKESEVVTGKWYSRTDAREVFVQLNNDGSFIHSASLPHATPAIVQGEWRVRGGYLVLHIKSFTSGKTNLIKRRQNNPYAMLKLRWENQNALVMDGDMPASDIAGSRYEMHRAEFPDMKFIPAIPFRPDSPRPRYVGEEALPTSGPTSGSETKVEPATDPMAPAEADENK